LGAFVVFDITSRKSFQSVDYWLGQLKEKAVENVAVMLIGNKNDRAQYRDVSRQEAEEKARMVGIPYAETSAADAGSLEQIFMHLASSNQEIIQ
jgi:GTPase SAR1 family protein